MKVTFLAAMVLLGRTLFAQEPPYERVMIPLAIAGEVLGAFGSRFTTQVIVRNDADSPVLISQQPLGCGRVPCGLGIERKSSQTLLLSVPNGRATFIYVEAPGKGQVTFNARVQDVSRQALTWGTELPIVRDSDWFVGRAAQIINVPTDARFRQTLRVFEDIGGPTRTVRIRIFPMDSEVPLVDTTRTTILDTPNPGGFPSYPAYVQINHLVDEFPQLAAVPRVRVELSAPFAVWGFVSVTNNETQHITTVTPEY